jgi:hypothetical protein
MLLRGESGTGVLRRGHGCYNEPVCVLGGRITEVWVT